MPQESSRASTASAVLWPVFHIAFPVWREICLGGFEVVAKQQLPDFSGVSNRSAYLKCHLHSLLGDFLHCPFPASTFGSGSLIPKLLKRETWSFLAPWRDPGDATQNCGCQFRNFHLDVGWVAETQAGCAFNGWGKAQTSETTYNCSTCFTMPSWEAGRSVLQISCFVCYYVFMS